MARSEPEGRVPESLAYPYFAYGSNLNRADMRGRCPDARALVVARLEGWRLTFRGCANIEPAEDRTVHGALWWLSRDDAVALDAYEGAPTYYRQRIVVVRTDAGPRRAIAYLMERPSYLGLPSPSYFGRIAEGFRDWGLPVRELQRALSETRRELERLGVARYDPDGPKRMRAILGTSKPLAPQRADGPEPEPGDELRVWLDDDLEDRAAPEGWIHATTRPRGDRAARHRTRGRALPRPRPGRRRAATAAAPTWSTSSPSSRRSTAGSSGPATESRSTRATPTAATRCAGRSAATPRATSGSRESLSPGGKPVFRFEPLD